MKTIDISKLTTEGLYALLEAEDSEIEGLSDEENENRDELTNSRTEEAGMYYLVMTLILSLSIPPFHA